MDHFNGSHDNFTNQANSSDGNKSNLPSQEPSDLMESFDWGYFEGSGESYASMLGYPEEFSLAALSTTLEKAPEHYDDLSNIEIGPTIAYPHDHEEIIDAGPSDWLDEAIAASSHPEIHRSSSVPPTVTISSPVEQGLWNPLPVDAAPFQHWSSSAPITRPTSSTALRPMQSGLYLNPILNSFTSPGTPLRVIDTYRFPFEEELQAALEKELQHQNELAAKQELADFYQAELNRRRESREALEAKLALVQQYLPAPPTPAPTPAVDGARTPRNKRPINILSTDPTKWYRPLSVKPHSWGPVRPDTGEFPYNYTAYGELDPRRTFDVHEIGYYISTGRATLWVQTVPADSGRRYPTKTSDKCRFSCCPDPLRTIRKGDFRVAFDEQHPNSQTDPFHNAGYVHLFCLEKFLDFPDICKRFNVQPEMRNLPEGKNKMAITRDHRSMERVVEDFIRDCVPWAEFGIDKRRPAEYYEYTLCSKLTKEHLAKQPRHLQTIRERRGGNTIDRHQNNLDVYIEGQRELKKKASTRPAGKRPAGRPKGTGKGRADGKRIRGYSEESEDSGLDDDILQRGLVSPPMNKRLRMSPAESSSSKRKPRDEGETDKFEVLSKRVYKKMRSGRRISSVKGIV